MNIFKKLMKKIVRPIKVDNECLELTYIKFFGLLFLVRVNCKPKYIDSKIKTALDYSVDITKAPKARGKRRRLQLADLKLLDIFDLICKKHDIPYFISAGTLLGAVRHKGFIPWDDDIDTVVPPNYRDKIQEILEQELKGTNLDLFGIDKTRWDVTLRITHKDFNYLNLDVFYPYALNAEESDRGRVYAAWYKAYKHFIERYNKEYTTENRESIWKLRHECDEYYHQLFPEMVDFFDEKAKYCTASIHFDDFKFIPMKAFWPLSQIEFEGKMRPCPADPELFLSNYGDIYSFPSRFAQHDTVFQDFKESDLDAVEKDLDDIYNKIRMSMNA